MPVFEYVVAVTPPGGHNTRYLRGQLFQVSKDEEAAAKEAIQRVSMRYGFNLKHQYSCVVFNMSGDDEE